MWGRLAWAGLLVAYAILLGIVGVADWEGRKFNDPDGGNESGYSPIRGEYSYPSPPPLLLPSNAYLALGVLAIEHHEYGRAEEHLAEALHGNLVNGKAALMLLRLYNSPLQNSNSFQPPPQPVVDGLANITFALQPSYTDALITLAEYWSKRKQDEKTVQTLSRLLTNNSKYSKVAFPIFHAALQDPTLSHLMEPYVDSPPVWWKAFFRYLMANEQDTSLLQQYYLARLDSKHPPDKEEKNIYIAYLIKNHRWTDAYHIWSGIDTGQSKPKTLLYDGGFEDTDIDNQVFTWNIKNDKKAKINHERTSGTTGKYSLHITFKKGQALLFQHLSQVLLLNADHYRLEGQYRFGSFKTTKGLRWRINCEEEKSILLAQSEAFTGHGKKREWKTFKVDFSVPENCSVQKIILESDSQYLHHNTFEGDIWFDKLSISPLNKPQ